MDLELVEPLSMHMQYGYVEFLFCDKSCTDIEMKLRWLEAGTHGRLIHILLEYAATSGSSCSWNVTRKYCEGNSIKVYAKQGGMKWNFTRAQSEKDALTVDDFSEQLTNDKSTK